MRASIIHSVILFPSGVSLSCHTSSSSSFCSFSGSFSSLSSTTWSEYRQEVLPSFQVTTMSPALSSFVSPSVMDDVWPWPWGRDVPLSRRVEIIWSSSSSCFLIRDAAALYLAIFFLLLLEMKQEILRMIKHFHLLEESMQNYLLVGHGPHSKQQKSNEQTDKSQSQ